MKDLIIGVFDFAVTFLFVLMVIAGGYIGSFFGGEDSGLFIFGGVLVGLVIGGFLSGLAATIIKINDNLIDVRRNQRKILKNISITDDNN